MAKKYRKSFQNVGNLKYDFEYQFEKNVYSNLCLRRVRKKELKKMDEKFKFTTYFEWKRYIWNKYEDYDKELLVEFSRYLNQGIRNVQPGREYLSFFVPVILTVYFSEMLKKIIEVNDILSKALILSKVLLMPIAVLLLFGPLFYIIWSTLSPLWDNNVEENLYKDYKEIIDEMIEAKTNNESW